MAKKAGPDTPSSDYLAMADYWCKVDAMLEGTPAMRRQAKKFLPQYPDEPSSNYKHRCANSKYTNIFRDICENLAAKPFAKPTTVKEGSISDELKDLMANVDGRGTSLHNFASATFFNGIAYALDYIFVDMTKVPEGATVAEEKKLGARPYLVPLEATRVVALRTAIIDGEEQPIHLRVLEPTVIYDGWEETEVERVREYSRPKIQMQGGEVSYGPPAWTLYEKQKNKQTGQWEWVPIETGTLSIGIIPLVPFVTGRRKPGTWQFYPSMSDAADLQIEHHIAESNLKVAKEMGCFPMLSASGVAPATDKNGKPVPVPIGPMAVLYAPAAKDGSIGSWNFIEPSATSLDFLSKEVDKIEQQLREAGRQPLTAQSGNLTVITAAVAAGKGNSAVQAWGLNLKTSLERAVGYMAKWLKDDTSKPEINVYTDFGIETGDGSSMDRVMRMRENGDLDQDTLWDEAQRRGELSADFDREAARRKLADEAPMEPSAEDLNATVVPGPGRRPPPQPPPKTEAA